MEKKNKKYMYITISIIALILIAIGISYAIWMITKEQTGENVVNSSCLNVTMEDEIDSIDLKKTQPILDEEGLNLKPFSFKIKNNCEEYADYTINLEMLSETTLESKYVKIALSEKGDRGVATKLDAYDEYKTLKGTGTKEGRQLKSGKLKPSEEKDYELRIWLDEDVTVEDDTMGKMYKSKIIVESEIGEKPYTESILNGTDPVLEEGLIPITINEENGLVTRADETKKWYSYAEQKWANAVILRDGVEDPGANEPIEENDIESYFVWIPRYRYEIFDDGNYDSLTTIENKAKQINVEFENKDEPVQSGTSVGQMLTHPAFTAFNTNGFWVGKFETGYNGANQTTDAEVNPKGEAASIEAAKKVIIKPNVYSWRNIQIAPAYVIGRNYKESLNSHMMKNTEWGAVAYLSQSKYGSREKIRINNNISYLTGYAGKHEPTTGYTATNESCIEHEEACNEFGQSEKGQDGEYNTEYFNKESVIASTTDNYTGVFDMSGGAWEYVMGGMDDGSGKLVSGRNNVYNSGFKGLLTCPACYDNGEVNSNILEVIDGIDLPRDERYYDIYVYSSTNASYTIGMFGDATKEMGPFESKEYNTQRRNVSSWYEQEGWSIYFVDPWYLRGGESQAGTGSGVLSFTGGRGCTIEHITFRLVLAF